MGLQQHRRSKAVNRARRAIVMRLDAPEFLECPKCHELKQPHKVCPACGYYKDREVVAIKKEK